MVMVVKVITGHGGHGGHGGYGGQERTKLSFKLEIPVQF